MLSQRLNFGGELAGVPHLDQYWGAWAIEQGFANFLVSWAQNLNLQLHLEQHVGDAKAASGSGGSSGSRLVVDNNGIAIIEINGTLMKHATSMAASTSLVEVRRQVRAAISSQDVKGVLLIIDSPGGTVAGTADLAADIKAAAAKKPVFAYIEDMGASGAYWLASQASSVTANSTALVGSIGVFTVIEDSSQAAANDGAKVHVVRFGEFKGVGTPGTQVTDEHLSYMQERINAFGQDFILAIASGRNMTTAEAAKLADGKVYKGQAAVAVGLIDAIESIDDAYASLVATTKKGKKTMSNSVASGDENATRVATIAELEAACKGASSDFILAQAKAGATLNAALSAHVELMAKANSDLAAKNVELAKENTELKAKIAELEARKPGRGVAPIASGESAEADEASGRPWAAVGAKVFLSEKLVEYKAKGFVHGKAVDAVFAANPGLREALVDEANG